MIYGSSYKHVDGSNPRFLGNWITIKYKDFI